MESGSGFKGDFPDFFKEQSAEFQKNLLGPKRYELWKEGKVTGFRDFVDQKTGKLVLIKDLE